MVSHSREKVPLFQGNDIMVVVFLYNYESFVLSKSNNDVYIKFRLENDGKQSRLFNRALGCSNPDHHLSRDRTYILVVFGVIFVMYSGPHNEKMDFLNISLELSV